MATIDKNIFQFLSGLKANNTKEYFDANKKQYEVAKASLITFAEALIREISQYDDSYSHIEPKKCVFRQHRDVRFSKDKSPYKTNMGLWLSPGGKDKISSGLYLHIEPGEMFVAGGVYMPMPPELKAIRQEIDYNFSEFKKIVENKDFKANFKELKGSKLKTIPKGYDAENPAIEYLKHKDFIVDYYITSEKEILAPNFYLTVAKLHKTMSPLLKFLNNALAEVSSAKNNE